MAAVSDSSPLILYARIGRLDLLRQLFDEVLTPPAVRAELTREDKPGAEEIARAEWIRLRPLGRLVTSHGLPPGLGAGEAEAIALALELGDAPVLLDDADGRRAALERGLGVIGSGGVLVVAKERGFIPAVRPLLDDLRAAGLYLADAVYRRILARSHEP